MDKFLAFGKKFSMDSITLQRGKSRFDTHKYFERHKELSHSGYRFLISKPQETSMFTSQQVFQLTIKVYFSLKVLF